MQCTNVHLALQQNTVYNCTPVFSNILLKTKKRTIGDAGEQLAIEHCKQLGYTILNTNVRVGRGEIDIVAYHEFQELLLFIEVKTRSKKTEFRAEANLSYKKIKAMKQAAGQWCYEHHYEGAWRTDAIFVTAGKVSGYVTNVSLD